MAKYALLVASETYADPAITPLKYAVADATDLADRLRSVCGFDQVRLLADGSPDGAPEYNVVADALDDLVSEMRQDDLFLFFFAGHGVELNGHAYLMTRDTRQRDPQRGLPLSKLMEVLQRMEARQRILLVDACRNDPRSGRGDANHPMGDILARDIAAVASASPNNDTTTALFSACSKGQRAHEWTQKRHGVFTHYLLEGLDGPAWQNSELEFRRIALHAAEQVRVWSGKQPGVRQEPWYQEFGVPRPIILARRPNASAAPRLSQEELDALFDQAGQHRDRLEIIENHEILQRISRDYPAYRHSHWESTPAQLMAQEMPDYRRSILLVVGYLPLPQIHDGTQAHWLREEINRRGRPERKEVAYVVADRGLAENENYQKCAQIAIGGPTSNSLTSKLREHLKTDASISDKGALIQHDIDGALRQVSLWGQTSEQTSAAVKLFVSSGLLDRFLKLIWQRHE